MPRTNLAILSPGAFAGELSEAQVWKRVIDRTGELVRSFDFVLVNAPVVNPLSDVSFNGRLEMALREAFLVHLGVTCGYEFVCSRAGAEDDRAYVCRILTRQNSTSVTLFSGNQRLGGVDGVCARVGVALARQCNRTVCVVDANFRNPSLHKHLHLDKHPGLLDAVSGGIRANGYTHQVAPGNLWVVTAGARNSGPSPLPWDRMRTAVEELSSDFDYLIINASPLSSSNVAHLMSEVSDGIIVVVTADQSQRIPAVKAIEELRRSRPNSIAAVLYAGDGPGWNQPVSWLSES
jgi:hypothetical protein